MDENLFYFADLGIHYSRLGFIVAFGLFALAALRAQQDRILRALNHAVLEIKTKYGTDFATGRHLKNRAIQLVGDIDWYRINVPGSEKIAQMEVELQTIIDDGYIRSYAEARRLRRKRYAPTKAELKPTKRKAVL